jgi:hypothetical protein
MNFEGTFFERTTYPGVSCSKNLLQMFFKSFFSNLKKNDLVNETRIVWYFVFSIRLYSLDRSRKGNFQDRRFTTGCSSLGKTQKSSRDELRQIVQISQTILQEGNHEEDRQTSETSLPVLYSLSPLMWKTFRTVFLCKNSTQ